MKQLYMAQAAFLVLGAGLLWLTSDWRAASSYAAGSALVFANVGLLAWLWGRMLAKKLVALSLFIIVFKYAILGVILYQLLKVSWLSPLWFCAGIGTLMLAALGAALTSNLETEPAV